MMRSISIPRLGTSRRGTTVVETALVLPLFLMLILVFVEVGRVMMIRSMLQSACRAGARMGTVSGTTSNEVDQFVSNRLGTVANLSAVSVFIKNAGVFDAGGTPPESGSQLEALPDIELADAETRQLFMVRARVNYGDIALMPNAIPKLGPYLEAMVVEGQAFMRKE